MLSTGVDTRTVRSAVREAECEWVLASTHAAISRRVQMDTAKPANEAALYSAGRESGAKCVLARHFARSPQFECSEYAGGLGVIQLVGHDRRFMNVRILGMRVNGLEHEHLQADDACMVDIGTCYRQAVVQRGTPVPVSGGRGCKVD